VEGASLRRRVTSKPSLDGDVVWDTSGKLRRSLFDWDTGAQNVLHRPGTTIPWRPSILSWLTITMPITERTRNRRSTIYSVRFRSLRKRQRALTVRLLRGATVLSRPPFIGHDRLTTGRKGLFSRAPNFDLWPTSPDDIIGVEVRKGAILQSAGGGVRPNVARDTGSGNPGLGSLRFDPHANSEGTLPIFLLSFAAIPPCRTALEDLLPVGLASTILRR